MKRVLVISPHFPPVNAPDMQRIRMSLPYFGDYNWEPVIISVDENYVDGYIDQGLLETIPPKTEIHRTEAFSNGLTRAAGIGSIALRSIYQIYKKGCELLSCNKFDLVFFTTSNFHVCTLGPLWKEKFNVPFVVDFQDPWYDIRLNGHSTTKQKLSNALHKQLEAYTIPRSDGIIAVSPGYIKDIRDRFSVYNKPAEVINFGSTELDFDYVKLKNIQPFEMEKGKINVVYPGALTPGFLPVIKSFFRAFNESNLDRSLYRFYFVGTSYFKREKGILSDFISENNLESLITEYPDRISYFETLATMQSADILFLPGSTDSDYNPSKICNAIMSGTPVFAVFNNKSIIHRLIANSNAGVAVSFESNNKESEIYALIKERMAEFSNLHKSKHVISAQEISEYSAKNLTGRLCHFFDKVLEAGK